jgi:hypothetical protein
MVELIIGLDIEKQGKVTKVCEGIWKKNSITNELDLELSDRQVNYRIDAIILSMV